MTTPQPESHILSNIRTALSNGDVRLLRNNVGALEDRSGRYVTFGLGVGTSDLIGWRSVVITPDMVGTRLAVFAAIEVKATTGAVTAEQNAFISVVRQAGGIAGVARSVQDASQLLEAFPTS